MTVDDAVIVGAGPAGAAAAILLAEGGARVRLLDKALFPREKLCGEFVSPEALPILDRVGVLSGLAGDAGRASAVVFTTPSGGSIRLPVPAAGSRTGEALGIPRKRMDAALVARASERGVDVIEGFEVREIGRSDAKATEVRGRARGSAETVAFTGRILIAADGRDSTLARLMDPARRGRASPRFGLKAHFTNVEDVSGAVELHWFRGGYVGLTDLGDGLVNVCSLVDRSVAGDIPRDPQRIFDEVFFRNPFARRRLAHARRVTDWHAVGSLVFRSEIPVRGGVVFLGDAAGTIDPFAGEGMSMALRSAEIAAEEILQNPDAARARYAVRWRAEFTRRIAFARTLGRLAIRPAFQRPLIGVLGRMPALGRWIARGTRAGAH